MDIEAKDVNFLCGPGEDSHFVGFVMHTFEHRLCLIADSNAFAFVTQRLIG